MSPRRRPRRPERRRIAAGAQGHRGGGRHQRCGEEGYGYQEEEEADVLHDEQAVGAVRGDGGHTGDLERLRHLHRPAGQGVDDQAVRVVPRSRGHVPRPRVHPQALPLRRRRRRSGVHQEPLRPGVRLLQPRLLRQPVPRLHGRAVPAVPEHSQVRRRRTG